jgi:hypothetical protein
LVAKLNDPKKKLLLLSCNDKLHALFLTGQRQHEQRR